MNWISVDERLPDFGQYVFCYMGNYGQSQKYRVCRRIESESGSNNTKPYVWSESGPMTFFGQECTHWAEIHPPKN
jgi:hypothetical protein